MGEASQQVAGREDVSRMQKKTAKKKAKTAAKPSKPIASHLKQLSDWRGETLARVRQLIQEADADMVEEAKWKKPSNPAGAPTWSHDGIVCTGETYKTYVKLTFAKGAALADPAGLFNASLDGNVRRAIDIHEGDKINEKALKALLRAAVALNQTKPRKSS